MIRQSILKGIRSTRLPVVPTGDQLAEIERKVAAATPERPENFAFVAGRNWAVSAARHADAEQRRLIAEAEQRRLIAEAERRTREQEELRAFEAAREEARELIARLAPRVKPSQRVQLELVWWKAFEERTAEECARLLPGTNADCRVKRFQRGRELLLRNAPPALRAFLSHRVSPSGGVTATQLPPSRATA